MLIEVNEALGHKIPLDSIAQATFGCEKIADGLQAIRWYREGKLAEIAEYCLFDVKITKMVHEYGRAWPPLLYRQVRQETKGRSKLVKLQRRGDAFGELLAVSSRIDFAGLGGVGKITPFH